MDFSRQEGLYFGIGIAIAASIISGVANTPFNAMPMFLGAAADAFQLIPSQIGLLGGVTLFGWVAGTAWSFFFLHKVSWRAVSIVGILIAVAGLLMSLIVESVSALYLCWFVLGFGASLPTCVTFEVMAQTRDPERSFGMLTFSIVLVSALVLYLFPIFLLSRWQYSGMILGLVSMFLALLLLTWKLPKASLARSHKTAGGQAPKPPVHAWVAFAAFLIFFTGQSGLWAFLERVGNELSIEPQTIGLVLAILKLIGGLACIVAMAVGSRFGNRWPFVAGFIGIVAGAVILELADSSVSYAAGGWVWEFFFTLVFCYSTATISRLDTSGRVVLLLPGAIGLGGAIGPTIAGYLKTGPGFLATYAFAGLCMFVCMCVFLTLLSRKRMPAAVLQPNQ